VTNGVTILAYARAGLLRVDGMPPVGVFVARGLDILGFDDDLFHIDFRDRTVTFNGRPLDLDPPQYNMLVLLIQRPRDLAPLDQINVVVRSGADDGIRDGAEGERLEYYQTLQDFERAWYPVYGALCRKLGFTLGDKGCPLYSDRPVTGLGYRTPTDD
jgi:hypothetical protein